MKFVKYENLPWDFIETGPHKFEWTYSWIPLLLCLLELKSIKNSLFSQDHQDRHTLLIHVPHSKSHNFVLSLCFSNGSVKTTLPLTEFPFLEIKLELAFYSYKSIFKVGASLEYFNLCLTKVQREIMLFWRQGVYQ